VLLPVGNSLAEAAEKPWTDEVAWDVNEDDGTVFEAKDGMYTSCNYFFYHNFIFK
jgi:hypothetical protein